MVQIVSYSKSIENYGDGVEVNILGNEHSPDVFDINVIDLSDPKMWRSESVKGASIDAYNHLESLSTVISNSKQTRIVILLPANVSYRWDKFAREERYSGHAVLKDRMHVLYDVLNRVLPQYGRPVIIFENTITKLEGRELKAAFCFLEKEKNEQIEDNLLGFRSGFKRVVTRSDGGNKATTVEVDERVWLSALQIKNEEDLDAFLRTTGLIKQKEDIPEWLKSEEMFDDKVQSSIISKNKSLIQSAEEEIMKAQAVLDKNNRYKSILSESGGELVKVVFEILEDILKCDLSSFEDKKKADFIVEVDNNVFVGEIKGISPNVRSIDVSKLDNHYHDYLDNNKGNTQNVKALLIINHQRIKPLDERENVNEEQINLAIRNESLIVETTTLLKMYEQYLKGELSREACINLLIEKKGILELEA